MNFTTFFKNYTMRYTFCIITEMKAFKKFQLNLLYGFNDFTYVFMGSKHIYTHNRYCVIKFHVFLWNFIYFWEKYNSASIVKFDINIVFIFQIVMLPSQNVNSETHHMIWRLKNKWLFIMEITKTLIIFSLLIMVKVTKLKSGKRWQQWLNIFLKMCFITPLFGSTYTEM